MVLSGQTIRMINGNHTKHPKMTAVYIYIYIHYKCIYIYIYTKQLCDFKRNNKFIINTTISQSLAKSTKEPDALNEHMLLVSTRKVVGGIHHDISRTLGSFTKNHMATSMKPDETHESFPRFIYLKSKERIYQKPKDFNDFWPRDAFIIGNLVRCLKRLKKSCVHDMLKMSTFCQRLGSKQKAVLAFWTTLFRPVEIKIYRLQKTSSSCMEFSYSFTEK